MSAGTDTELDADVAPCRVCQSPVFDDEAYCESCGAAARVEAPPPPAARPTTTRSEQDLGVIAVVTDVGLRRHRNEDAFAVAQAAGRAVVAVCDGVASTANGDKAARAAADAALGVFEALRAGEQGPHEVDLQAHLDEAFDEAQRMVLQIPDDDDPRGNDASPSTTLVVAVVTPEKTVIGNVGDSRAYWLSAKTGLSRVLTVDDSWAQEQIGLGMPPELANGDPDAHTITRWIGGDTDSWNPSLAVVEPSEAGLLVLCTDGLWSEFEDPERMARLIADLSSPPIEIARNLVDAALAAGGRDNITVAVVAMDPSSLAGDSRE
jgi:serine/threonine protein phosphatase PrpC